MQGRICAKFFSAIVDIVFDAALRWRRSDATELLDRENVQPTARGSSSAGMS
jgi:hypothetical protein